MNWFNRLKSGIRTIARKGMPDDLWVKCQRCHQTLYKKQLDQNAGICSHCGHHFRVSSKEYLDILVDPGSFEELFTEVRSADSLKFVHMLKYSDQLRDYTKRTGMTAAIRTGVATIDGVAVGIGVHEFQFAGGSLGSAEGERICRLIDRCEMDRRPLILVCRAGGARMQESALSLMQLAKINARLARFAEARMLFISIMADPTTAGVSASYAMIGDVNLAEPNALIGFTGERITSSSVGEQEQEELRRAQRAEKVLEHGFVDLIVSRDTMRAELSRLLSLLWGAESSGSPQSEASRTPV